MIFRVPIIGLVKDGLKPVGAPSVLVRNRARCWCHRVLRELQPTAGGTPSAHLNPYLETNNYLETYTGQTSVRYYS